MKRFILLLTAFLTAVSAFGENRIAIGAHRGFWKCEAAQNAENTIASLREAQVHNFWGSEFDVHITADDVVIVNHNKDIDGMVIWDHNYSDFKDVRLKNGEKVPSLDEYLTQAEGCPGTVLVFELKKQKNAEREDVLLEKSIEALKAHGLYSPDRVIFISFSLHLCKEIARIAPEFTNQYLNGELSPAELQALGINGLDYHYNIIRKHPEWVSEAHELGMSVNVWTVDKREDIEEMIGLGVDCITTNEPLLVRELLGKRELRNAPAPEEDPKADPKAEVVFGKARFTVLTPRLIRMEWAEDGVFEDRATLGIVNRRLDVPQFKVSKSGKKLTIKTSDLVLTYRGEEKFSAENLSVVFSMADPSAKKGVRKVTWKPGMDESGNLLGTTRTLDGCDGERVKEPYDKGVISRDGWAVIDESSRHVFVPVSSDWKNWVACRPEGDREDLYLFAYGHDYTAAVSDFTKVAGRIPLPPKYAFGYWWCRYWQYSDFEFVDLAKHIRSFGIPIDVMVLDMDWHDTWTLGHKGTPNPKDEFGQWVGWTGYTWKKELFPNPANHLRDLHNLGLKTTLNLHPASGIQPYEEPYERFTADYASRGGSFEKGRAVPFHIDEEIWADAYFNSVIRPLERQGVDFWWLDWQQWRLSKYTPELSNTFWLNYTFFNDIRRQSVHDGIYARRPMIYHRWGGIGSHRYQIGFSGDTYATWKVLGFLPEFTSRASNVGYGYWGHDIGGHMQPKGVTETDPELYTRWLQGGVFTPIFKTHSTKDMTMEKRFWVFPDHFDAMRAAIRLRYDLSPYIYNAARETYDTGLSMCRPLYWYYPEDERAYNAKEEFFFGNDILATVVCKPVDSATGLAERTMWFPEGSWFDVSTGAIYEGDRELTLLYTIDENPWFIKAGAVIPLAGEDISSLQEKSDVFRLLVAPGEGSFKTTLYEDDGSTQAYMTEFATTEISKDSDASSLRLTVAGRKGTFSGISSSRTVSLLLPGIYAPERILVNGAEIPYSRFAEGECFWTYSGADLTATVFLGARPAEESVNVEVIYSKGDTALLNGRKGLIRRFMALTPDAKLESAQSTHKSVQLSGTFLDCAQCGSYITEDPAGAEKYLKAFDTKERSESLDTLPWRAEFKEKLKAQLHLSR